MGALLGGVPLVQGALLWLLWRQAHGRDPALQRRLRELLPAEDVAAMPRQASCNLAADVDRCLPVLRRHILELEDEKRAGFARDRLTGYRKRCAEAAMEALPDGLMLMDESGVVTYANTRVEALIGVPAGVVIGHMPHEWCDNPEVVGMLARYYGGASRLRRPERVEFTPADGVIKRVSVRALPLNDVRGGQSTAVLLRDISVEVLLRQSRDDFVAHVAHELKSPLNVIGMHAELLADTMAAADPDSIAALNVIEDEVSRLATLINDLLNLTRLESGSLVIDRQRVKLAAFLEDVFETTQRAATAKGLTAILDLPPRLSTVALDKDLFRIALNNLLTNAVKYNRPGGQVTLRAVDGDDTLSIEVVDTGIGIPEHEKSRIFDKFYRADDSEAESRGGHGLGLALAREIVQLHNGQLSVHGEFGQGSTFTIALRKTAHLLQETV